MAPWEEYASQSQNAAPASQKPWEEYQGTSNASAENPSYGRTAVDYGLRGATFGLGNTIANALGADYAAIKTGRPVGELYNEATANQKQRMSAELQQNPKTAIGSELTGGLVTGVAGAGTKAGAAIADSLGSGNIAARVAKGALAGAASGGLYGAGTADQGKMLEGAKEGATSGAVLGAALPVAGAALGSVAGGIGIAAKGALARSPEAVQDVASAAKSGAGALYNKMRDVGAVLNSDSTDGLLSDITSEVGKNKFIPALNPKTTGIIDHLAETIKNNNGQIGFDELDQYRRLLGRVGGSEDGVSAGAAKRAIDNVVTSLDNKGLVNGGEEAVSLLKQGRAAYAQASKFEDVADILTKADGDPNKIKSGLTRFLNNTDNTAGWNYEELSTLRDAARSGIGEKLLKMGGKFGIDLGSSLNAGNTVLPILSGSLSGGVAPALGTVARQLQKYMARGKAEQLLQTLQSGRIPKEIGSLPPSIAQQLISSVKGGGLTMQGAVANIGVNP